MSEISKGPDTRQPAADKTVKLDSAAELTRQNVDRILALEAAEHGKATTADRAADAITGFSGSIRFVWITVLLIGGWVVVNSILSEESRIDAFPFPLLTLVLSIEAIFLAIFILMSQKRAAQVSEKRSHLELQLTMLSEQENTKMLLMLEQIRKAVGVEAEAGAEMDPGPAVSVLAQSTEPEALSEQIDRAAEAAKQPPAG